MGTSRFYCPVILFTDLFNDIFNTFLWLHWQWKYFDLENKLAD